MKLQIVILLTLCLFSLTAAKADSKYKIVPEVPAKTLEKGSLAQTNSQQYTTSRSWGDNISDAITGFCIGVVLIISMPALLWFNEKRAVDVVKEIMKAESIVKSSPYDKIDTPLEGELVHVSGETNNSEAIKDPFFNVSVDASIRLKRTVHAYQYYEQSVKEKDAFGGGSHTRHYYQQDWFEDHVNSANFADPGHKADNDKVKFIAKTQAFNGQRVTLGSHVLADSQMNQLNCFESITLVGGTENNLSQEANAAIKELGWDNAAILCQGNTIYIKHVKDSFNTGDLKIEFSFVKCQPVSIMAQQKGETFQPYPIRERMEKDAGCFEKCLEGCQNGCTSCFCYCPCCVCVKEAMKAPTDLDWIYTGVHDVKAIVQKREEENDTTTKIMRIVGLILLILGFYLLFAPIIEFMSIIAFLGNIVAIAALIVSILLGLALGFTVIAISWIFYRPLYGLLLLSLVGGIIYFIYYASQQGAAEEAAAGGKFLQLN